MHVVKIWGPDGTYDHTSMLQAVAEGLAVEGAGVAVGAEAAAGVDVAIATRVTVIIIRTIEALL